MNYDEAIQELTSKGRFHIDLGLDRIRKVLERLGNPQESLKCIHVAGTNGKGSVCAILNSILIEAGYKVGLYTSPHIYDYTERIKVNNQEISKGEFIQIFEEVLDKSKDVELTEFEILTIMGFLYFKKNNVDYVVLETGLGGRLDATNVIKSNICSVITQIDLDHTDRLGATKDDIAFEKAGIIKENCPLITSMGYEVIKDRADELNSMLIFVAPFAEEEYIQSLSLKGQHQAENLALCLNVINYLFKNISRETILSALKKVKNPFRFEYFEDKNLIVDAAHNPNGIMALKNNLDLYFPNVKRRFVFGCLRTKDYEKMMKILFEQGDEIYLCEFDYKDACSYEELSKKCPYQTKKYSDDIKLTNDKLNIICGSFYMIGKIKF